MPRRARRDLLRHAVLLAAPASLLLLPGRGQAAPPRADREKELAAARAAGLPTDPATLRRPLPPAERNAAPLLARWRPPTGLSFVAENDTRRVADVLRADASPEVVRIARQLMTERADVLTLAQDAAERPECVPDRSLAEGLLVDPRQSGGPRELTRWLCARSRIQEIDGDPDAAARTAALALRLARLVASEPLPTPHLVANAMRALAGARLQELLRAHPDRAGVRAAIREAMAGEPPRPSADALRTAIPIALQCEAWLLADDDALGALGVPPGERGDDGFLSLLKTASRRTTLPTGPVPSRGDAKARRRWASDNVAEAVRAIRRVLTGEAPFDAVQQELTDASAECIRKETASPYVLALALLPEPARYRDGDRGAQARWAVLAAAVAVLDAREASGSLPESLPGAPRDPFGTGALGYRRSGDGFTVWSVGRSGAFDGSGDDPQEACFRLP